MSTPADLMGLGMSPALSARLGNLPQTVAGVGTSQSGAAKLSGSHMFLLTTASGQTAFVLDDGFSTGAPIFISNTTATTALIFTSLGGEFNSGSPNASFSLAQNKNAIMWKTTGTGASVPLWFVVLTA